MPSITPQRKRLKIFDTPWHSMHQFDMFNALKDDADFYLCHNSNRSWPLEARPVPENVHFVSYYEAGVYDLAILHVDQQLVNEQIGKRKVYVELNEYIQDIPKVVINHGSPVYPEHLCHPAFGCADFEQAEIKCRELIKELIGNNPMVVNSYEAASEREWGWGTPIVHGMNPDDWRDLPKEPRIFTALSPGGCDEYYNRATMQETARILEEKYGWQLWWAKVNVKTDKSFDFYRDFLGGSLLYLDTSIRTPMNRGRTEAMLSGCCVLQVEGAHDLDRFAKDGVNMIVVPNNPEIIAERAVQILEGEYKRAVEIGQAGRQTAIEMFGRERYRQDWLTLIDSIL